MPEEDDSPVTMLMESSIEIVELEADVLRTTQLCGFTPSGRFS